MQIINQVMIRVELHITGLTSGNQIRLDPLQYCTVQLFSLSATPNDVAQQRI